MQAASDGCPALVTLLNPCQDPILDFTFDKPDRPIAQRDWGHKPAFADVLVQGRPRQAGRVDDFFQTDDSHEQAPLYGSEDVLRR